MAGNPKSFLNIIPITKEAKEQEAKRIKFEQKPARDRYNKYSDLQSVRDIFRLFIPVAIILAIAGAVGLVVANVFWTPVWVCAFISAGLVGASYALDKAYDIDRNLAKAKRNLTPFVTYEENLKTVELTQKADLEQKIGVCSDAEYNLLTKRQFFINKKITGYSLKNSLGWEKDPMYGGPKYKLPSEWLTDYYIKALEKELNVDDFRSNDVIGKARDILRKTRDELIKEFDTRWANTDRKKVIDLEKFQDDMMKKMDSKQAVSASTSTRHQDAEDARRVNVSGERAK